MCWFILPVCCLIQGLCAMAMYSWGPLAPFLVNSFHVSRTQLGLFSTVSNLAFLIFSLSAGWLTDRIGIRLLLSICPGAMGLSYIIFSRASTLSQVYCIVFFIGLSYVLVNPTTTKAIRLWFPPNIRGTAISIKHTGVTLGGAAGAIILPSLSSHIGWRVGVMVVGFGIALGTVISYFFYRDPPWTMPPEKAKVLHFRDLWSVVKNRDLLLLSLACAGFSAVQFSVNTHLVNYLVEKRFFSPVKAGTYLLMVNIAGAMGRISWGLISDRVFDGQRRPVLMIIGVIIGLIVITIGFFGITMFDWLLYIVVLLLGFTAYGWNGIFLTAASEMMDDRIVASGIGWSVTLATLGLLIGPPLFGSLVDRTSSYGIAWTIFGFISGASILFLLPVRERKWSGNGNI